MSRFNRCHIFIWLILVGTNCESDIAPSSRRLRHTEPKLGVRSLIRWHILRVQAGFIYAIVVYIPFHVLSFLERANKRFENEVYICISNQMITKIVKPQ